MSLKSNITKAAPDGSDFDCKCKAVFYLLPYTHKYNGYDISR